jgi:hypothetical protein
MQRRADRQLEKERVAGAKKTRREKRMLQRFVQDDRVRISNPISKGFDLGRATSGVRPAGRDDRKPDRVGTL